MLASGVWLTASRVRVIAVISGVLGAAMLAFLLLAGEGTLDPFGQPIGTDFSAFWHAGRIANGGNPAAAWDLETLNAAIRATHVGSDFATAWVYPPVFLLVAAPLAALPYLPALIIWQSLSVALIVWTLKAILRDRLAVLVCLASPLTPMVLGHGQNAFLTSALLGGGLLALTRGRAGRAGLFGALACKPQLALQVAPLLLFTRNWRALIASLLVSAILVGVSLLLWGTGAWLAFHKAPRVRGALWKKGRSAITRARASFPWRGIGERRSVSRNCCRRWEQPRAWPCFGACVRHRLSCCARSLAPQSPCRRLTCSITT